jgi:hypothetical protein
MIAIAELTFYLAAFGAAFLAGWYFGMFVRDK